MKKYIFLILVISLFLASCGGSSSSVDIDYKTGAKDLKLDFFGDHTAYQERAFNLFMRLENVLGYTVNDVKVSVVGLDETYVDLSEKSKLIGSIEGKNKLNPAGENRNLEFTGEIRTLPTGAKEIDQNYLVYVDYTSNMEFSPTICVGVGLYNVEGSGCKNARNKDPRNQKLSFSGQGAPLAVTQMEIISGHDGRVELRSMLKNKGSGEVKKITLSTANLGGKEMNCEFRKTGQNKKEFTFTKEKKEAELLCDILVSKTSTFETPVYMDFIYDYRLKVKQKLKLKT